MTKEKEHEIGDFVRVTRGYNRNKQGVINDIVGHLYKIHILRDSDSPTMSNVLYLTEKEFTKV